jgi:hypothetical protein
LDRPERWNELIAAVRKLPGGAMLAPALSHAASVRLSLAGGLLELGFTAGQGTYRESLERPERAAALQTALTEVYGRAFQVSFARAERPPTAILAPPRDGKIPAREPAPRRAEEALATDEVGTEETEVEFGDPDALPLPLPTESGPPPEESSGASGTVLPTTVGSADEDTAAPAAEAVFLDAPGDGPPVQKEVRPNARQALEHPLIKMLVDRVGGEVLRVDPLGRSAKDQEGK